VKYLPSQLSRPVPDARHGRKEDKPQSRMKRFSGQIKVTV